MFNKASFILSNIYLKGEGGLQFNSSFRYDSSIGLKISVTLKGVEWVLLNMALCCWFGKLCIWWIFGKLCWWINVVVGAELGCGESPEEMVCFSNCCSSSCWWDISPEDNILEDAFITNLPPLIFLGTFSIYAYLSCSAINSEWLGNVSINYACMRDLQKDFSTS